MKEIEKRKIRNEKLKNIFFEMGMEEDLIEKMTDISNIKKSHNNLNKEKKINNLSNKIV